jgi:AAA+ superfamily predicted ATPase
VIGTNPHEVTMAKSSTAARKKSKKSAATPALTNRLRNHFGTDPGKLPVVTQPFHTYERANLHLTVEELVGKSSPPSALVGVVLPSQYSGVSLAKLSRRSTAKGYEEGPVEYVDVQLADDQKLACVQQGLYTFHDVGRPVALLIAEPERFYSDEICAEVMAHDRETAEKFARKLAKGVRHGSAFRGKVLSVEQDCHRRTTVRFHKLPNIHRENLILPEELLSRVERQAMGLTKHAEKLKAAGRHLKRGILMHGKPGTGKTLSAMYLAAQMPGRTVLVLTGGAVGSIEIACQLGRLLEPATIILEDVDLIGTERHQQTVGANALLFELLNQMDGLGEDADILFILTTNRPDYLEPALAARPGRIDLAIEVPLPDESCRRRLLELYGRGLKLELADTDVWVRRTNGVSAAFIRELLRKAAVLAAEDDGAPNGEVLVITDRHMEGAAAELLIAGGPLTKTLLGVCANGEACEQ